MIRYFTRWPERSLVFTILVLSACGLDEARQPFVDEDSAGVRLAVSNLPLWGSEPILILDTDPRITVDEALDPVDAEILPSGELAILDRGLPGLRIFDETGEPKRTIGEEGTGPGEFLRPSRVFAYRGDTIGIFDPPSSRVSLFSREGGFGRAILVASGYSGVSFLGSMSDGSFVFRGRSFEERGRNWREPTEMFVLEANGGEIRSFATVPGWEFYRVRFRGRIFYGVTPFGPRTTAIAVDEGVWVHSQEDCSIRFFNEGGRVTRILRNTCVRRLLPRDEIVHFQRTRPERFARPEDRELWGGIYRSRQVPYPKRIPAFQSLLEGPSGRLWAEEYPLPSDTTRIWEIFGKNGQWLGSVRVPAGLEIVRIQEETVICLTQDRFGHRSVQVHELRQDRQPQASSAVGGSEITSYDLGANTLAFPKTKGGG